MEFIRYLTERLDNFLGICVFFILITFCVSWLIMMIREAIIKIKIINHECEIEEYKERKKDD